MGRTIPSFGITLAMEEKEEWKPFRNVLDKNDRKKFDDVFNTSNQVDDDNNNSNFEENSPNDVRNTINGLNITEQNDTKSVTNTSPTSTEPGLPGLGGQSYSIEQITSELVNGKDYFTVKEWQTKLMFLPVQHPYHCDENQAQQTLHALVEERRIEEFEEGKYRPTEELSFGKYDTG